MRKTLLLSGAALMIAAGTARADIIFTEGNHPQSDEQNILFGAGETGTTLTGQVDHTGASVLFSSLTGQTLTQTAKGQAQIFCSANCVDNSPPPGTASQLDSIEMKAGTLNGSPTGWLDAIINLDFGTGDALVKVTDNLNATFTYALKSGSNFLTMVAVNGEFITDIQVTAANDGDFGFNLFKQPRVSGLCILGEGGCTVVDTPEPTTLALLGAGLLGLGLTKRRKETA